MFIVQLQWCLLYLHKNDAVTNLSCEKYLICHDWVTIGIKEYLGSCTVPFFRKFPLKTVNLFWLTLFFTSLCYVYRISFSNWTLSLKLIPPFWPTILDNYFSDVEMKKEPVQELVLHKFFSLLHVKRNKRKEAFSILYLKISPGSAGYSDYRETNGKWFPHGSRHLFPETG